jgi:hypothetical protein
MALPEETLTLSNVNLRLFWGQIAACKGRFGQIDDLGNKLNKGG